MSVILPPRLSWALSDRPARSKGMWFGILGAFVAGIAVAGVAGNIPKVAEGPSVNPEKAHVAAKVAPAKTAEAQPTGSVTPRKIAAKPPTATTSDKPGLDADLASKAVTSQAASTEPASSRPADDQVATNQTVRVIAADRITPPPGADAAPANPVPPASETPVAAAAPANTAAPIPVVPAEVMQNENVPPTAGADTPFLANSHELASGRNVPLPRNKPASLIATADASQPQTAPGAPPIESSGVVVADAVSPELAAVLLRGPVPMPRAKPAIEKPEIEVAARDPESLDRAALTARLENEDGPRSRRVARRDYDERSEEMVSRREMRRMERSEARASESRSRELRRRNEDEGFELVRTYRGPDGRRVSVYQRMEPRVVAYRSRPLFGRPSFLMPPRGYW